MNDLKTLTAQPRSVTIDGETHTFHPFTVKDWGALQAWLDEQHADPFEVVKATIAKGGFTVVQQQFLMEKALDKATRPTCRIGTAEADELLTSIQGYTQVIYLSIRHGRPDFTKEAAAELALKMAEVDAASIGLATTLNMMVSDPKDEPLDVRPPLKKSGPAASRPTKKAARKTGGESSTS